MPGLGIFKLLPHSPCGHSAGASQAKSKAITIEVPGSREVPNPDAGVFEHPLPHHLCPKGASIHMSNVFGTSGIEASFQRWYSPERV